MKLLLNKSYLKANHSRNGVRIEMSKLESILKVFWNHSRRGVRIEMGLLIVRQEDRITPARECVLNKF